MACPGVVHWATRDEFRLAIVTLIEVSYHRRRRQRYLGKLTPVGFETLLHGPARRPSPGLTPYTSRVNQCRGRPLRV